MGDDIPAIDAGLFPGRLESVEPEPIHDDGPHEHGASRDMRTMQAEFPSRRWGPTAACAMGTLCRDVEGQKGVGVDVSPASVFDFKLERKIHPVFFGLKFFFQL